MIFKRGFRGENARRITEEGLGIGLYTAKKFVRSIMGLYMQKSKPMLSVKTLAELMLSFSSMSNKKLQKICYYMYAWYLTIYNKKIAPIEFEAWVHGPVSRELYNYYKSYGWNDIPQHYGFILADNDTIAFAQKIWDMYGGYTADELEARTHQEFPWTQARKGYKSYEPSEVHLKDDDIKKYFSTLKLP